MKHTKGPWKVNTDNDGNINTVFSEYHGAICSFPKFYGVKETNEGRAELEANALLIAAAPEMIKFIHEFAQFLNAHQYEDKKILKGYTLAANLGEKATEFSTRAANIITKATQP